MGVDGFRSSSLNTHTATDTTTSTYGLHHGPGGHPGGVTGKRGYMGYTWMNGRFGKVVRWINERIYPTTFDFKMKVGEGQRPPRPLPRSLGRKVGRIRRREERLVR